MSNAIEVVGLGKRYHLGEDRPGRSLRESIAARVGSGLRSRAGERDELWSLRDVDLSVAEGEAIGVIGRNGAGKSTLLKILSRITEPTTGMSRTRGRVTSLLEVGTGFHPELTGRENVFLNGAILGMQRRQVAARFDEIVAFAGVERFIDTPVKRYSSGMYLRLAFAVAAHLDADIMVVDEVLAVGDAEFQARCLGRMELAGREGRTVVFVSHNLDAIARLCERSVWLDGGCVMVDGPSGDVVEAYLSGQADRTSTQGFATDTHGRLAVHTVEVLDETGAPVSVTRREHRLTIEVRFSVMRQIPGLDLAAYVLNVRGVEVLNEAWSDTAVSRSTEPGEYVARLDIPPVLNTGEYVVGVWFGSTYETLLQEPVAKRFRLEGDPRDRPKRSVVLELPWDVRVDATAARSALPISDADRG
jgi:ABC-2 type transport system ATP-binding protein/lipopolysaccharide transport system ATP-binding protein